VVGDKAFAGRPAREHLRRRRIGAVIPAKTGERRRPGFDRAAYRARNRVERLFNRLKQFRRLATRYEKRAANYLAMLHLGAILIWINAFADTPYYCAQMVGQAWLNPSLRRFGAEFKWGMAGPEELSLGEPRWRVVDTYSVMERLGWPYDVLWPSFRFFTGVRPYGIAHLRLWNGAGEHDGPTPEPQS